VTAQPPVFSQLWERVKERGEFPALRRAVDSINRAMGDEMASSGELVNAVLSDFALTQKVLRLANSAMYAPYGQNVRTVSRAITILGANAISHLALSLGVLDAFQGLADAIPDGERLLASAARSSAIAGAIAERQSPRNAEEARVFALMRHTGRLLAAYYFPEEWAEACRQASESDAVSLDDACRSVLGAAPHEFFSEAARRWQLPDELSRCAAPANLSEPSATHEGWLLALASFAQTAGALDGDEAALAAAAQEHAVALGLAPEDLAEVAAEAASAFVPPEEPSRVVVEGKPLDAAKRLLRGVEEIRAAGSQMDFLTLLRAALEHLSLALGCKASVAFARNAATKCFSVRAAMGPEADDTLFAMLFDEAFVPDVFHLPLSHGRPLFLDRAQEPRIATRLPGWHQAARPGVQSMLLAPVTLRGKPVALLYGDWGQEPLAQPLAAAELDALAQLLAAIDAALAEQLTQQAARQAQAVASA
jgi:HD-like signal output (HDOD) protein